MIQFSDLKKDVKIKIYNELQSLVYERAVGTVNAVEIKSGLPAGVYYVITISRNAQLSSKLIIL